MQKVSPSPCRGQTVILNLPSFGIELLPVPAHCARLQHREVQRRWAMWGLDGNIDIDFAEGDFRGHPDVAKRLREADVVVSPA